MAEESELSIVAVHISNKKAIDVQLSDDSYRHFTLEQLLSIEPIEEPVEARVDNDGFWAG